MLHEECLPHRNAKKFSLSGRVKVPVGKGLANHPYQVLRRNGRPLGEVYTEHHAGHRELYLLKHIQPRKKQSGNRQRADDDVFYVTEVQAKKPTKGKVSEGLSGSKNVACMER